MKASTYLNDKVSHAFETCNSIFLGKEDQLKIAFISMLSKGHLLIEDVPGVGKTTLVYLLSHIFGLNLSRIQFTNDLLASDILGTSIFDKQTASFIFNKGPIFSRMVLGDELNRASPKTQSALLQAMEERYITVDGGEYQLEEPFIVVATQNPLDQIGTNPLPESQLDRFFMSLSIGLPSREYEKKILLGDNIRDQINGLHAFLSLEEYLSIHKMIQKIHIEESLIEYVLNFLEYCRENLDSGMKLSLRAGRDLLLASRACAFFEKRDFVTPHDVQTIAPYVLAHRLNSRMGLASSQDQIREALENVAIR
ncbi:AAA family ATPase [Halobacteriovorax marinus]|uniref:AAA family ATPase n=1 Tax=Halobacteriovorax marinus TaxID=97084 RepID=UPI000BC321B0|nr:MoxR family ATPase [Halobacteriovorax marinus]ATH07584.1 AAA family ATPase [Halobacteriovorax marinus]